MDYYEDRTYAQRLNHWLSLPLQKSLAFVSTTEEGFSDDIDLKSLLKSIPTENRTGKPLYPPFNDFGNTSQDRNTTMTERTATDTAFANTVKQAWKFVIMSNKNPSEKDATTDYFARDAKIFNARGGNLILVQCPSSGMFKEGGTKFFQKSEYWDKLLS